MSRALLSACLLVGLTLGPRAFAQPDFITFESGPTRPLALSPDGSLLFALNTPDNQLEIFSIGGAGLLTRVTTVQVGMEPVAVTARTDTQVWVANHLSDSVSVVELAGGSWQVAHTLHVGDEPGDVVCAGPREDLMDGDPSDDPFSRCFVTAAHRGQSHSVDRSDGGVTGHTDPLGDHDTPGIGRADVWAFDATDPQAAPLAVIQLFGDKPRALAANADGSEVYAAVFHSGNRTTVVNEALVCDTDPGNFASDTLQGGCTWNSGNPGEENVPGGMAPPHQNEPEDADRPENGVIVKLDHPAGDPGEWSDELGRDWSGQVHFELPDRDVFVIDADALTPAAVDAGSSCVDGSGCWAGAGTVLFNMIVHPDSDKIYVANTDAQNHVRFEGNADYASTRPKIPVAEPPTVQGNLAQARITVLDGASVLPRHLNKHIDYSVLPAPASVRADSLATPLGMAIDNGGTAGTTADDVLYVAAFGSQAIGVFDVDALDGDTFTPNGSAYIPLGGGGPSGLALGASNRLYVMTRFDNTVRVIDPGTKTELQSLPVHNPEPASVVDGRPFLYDAQLTSSNGEASCSSCHIFGDMDDLGWDLGDPDGAVTTNTNPFEESIGDGGLAREFHPMKGPMTTQTLRGLSTHGPQHWRGDRQGSENAAFNAFIVAFEGLVGLDVNVTGRDVDTTEMQQFTDFALQIVQPPNPARALDDVERSGDEADGRSVYFNDTTDSTNCNTCHVLDPLNGHFGTDGDTTFEGETQHFKISHLRNVYQKIGTFGMPWTPLTLVNPAFPAFKDGAFFGDTDDFGEKGPQIRGFGFLHDGSIDTLFRFTQSQVFTGTTATTSRELEEFMMVFPSDLAPVVGQQVTLRDDMDTTTEAFALSRVTTLEGRASDAFESFILGGNTVECDLVVKVVEAGQQRGYLYDPDNDRYDPDHPLDSTVNETEMRNKALVNGDPVTWTCAPPGSGHRMALDRDRDTLLDGVETGTGVFLSPDDTGTDPGAADTDGDGFDDDVEVTAGTDPNDPNDFPGAPKLPVMGTAGHLALVTLLLGTARMLARKRRTDA